MYKRRKKALANEIYDDGYVEGYKDAKKEILEDLKRLPNSKESFRLLEKWEGDL